MNMYPILHESFPASTPKVKPDDIKRLAALARLHLTFEEEAECVTHVQTMVSYVGKLAQVNTDGVEPMAHAVEVPVLMREDCVTNKPNTETLLQNAPARAKDFFIVPRVIE
jgi:aspartyl-tRNA(Asn)/glutamyl-tRNA(Gln) amidotransferase subunit C